MTHDPFTNSEEEEFSFEGESSKLEIGDFILKVIDVEDGTSNKSGNRMLTWTYQVIETADGKEAPGAHELKDYLPLTDKMMWKIEHLCGVLNLPHSKEGNRVKLKFKKSDVIGTLCLCTTKEEEYDGVMRTKIDKLKPHPKGAGFKGGGSF